MKSMTGYGRSKQMRDGRTITVELRAVNHRYLDCTVKVPRQYGFLEESVKRMVSARVARGKVEAYVTLELSEGADTAVTVNHVLAKQYLDALRELSVVHGLPFTPSALDVARLPEVLGTTRVEQDADDLRDAVKSVLGQACDELEQMRLREGARLCADIEAHSAQVMQLIEQIEQRAPQRVEEYRARLLARMREALEGITVDEGRLLTEAALYADRTAIDEETVRLRSHVAQLHEMLGQEQPVGRKLDFLVQEMNREANTIGSKANDVALAGLVVALKSELEKIREQVQNIE